MTLNLQEARDYCRKLATTHYENFTVAARILPREILPHFYVVYAYCRYSDDLADEISDSKQALNALLDWEKQLFRVYDGEAHHPIFVALSDTIKTFDIPIEPFHNLLKAFKMDQAVKRYNTYEELLSYCRYSANPVGHLVLYLFNYRDKFRQELSDATCTALQLINFWQDIEIDYRKGRIYLPLEEMSRFGVNEKIIAGGQTTAEFRSLMEFQLKRTEKLFKRGLKLICHIKPRYASIAIEMFSRGGMKILEGIRRNDYDIFRKRPTLDKKDKRSIAIKSILSANWI